MYLLIEFNLISLVLMLKRHSSLLHLVFIFCRASFLYYKPCRFVYESLLGHTLVQDNKHHLPTSIAFVSVCHHRPSTGEATPSNGDSLKPATTKKIGTQCGAYGWWQRHYHQQQAAGQPPNGQPKNHTKNDFSLQINTSKCMTLAGQLIGQHKQCTLPSQVLKRQCSSALYHHKCTDEEVLGSSAQLTPGDIGCDQVTKTPEEISPC